MPTGNKAHKSWVRLVTVQRLQRCYSGGRLPRKRNRANNTVVVDHCTTQTVVADYRGSITVQIPPWFLITVPSKPLMLITAEEAYRANTMAFYYRTKQTVAADYRRSVTVQLPRSRVALP